MRRRNDILENVFDQVLEIELSSVTGKYHLRMEFPSADLALLRCTTSLIPAAPLFIPFFPRDIIPLGPVEDLTHPEGVIYTKQVGPRTGMVYFSLSKPRAGTVMYFQNLTALNDYAEQTNPSLQEVVGGNWPELGKKSSSQMPLFYSFPRRPGMTWKCPASSSIRRPISIWPCRVRKQNIEIGRRLSKSLCAIWQMKNAGRRFVT